MIKHTIQKKRVIVMDCDVDIDDNQWKSIMRHVLGRHYADLQGNGSGWSFSHNHLDTFLEKCSNQEKEQADETCLLDKTKDQELQIFLPEDNKPETREQELQTLVIEQKVCSTQTETVPHVYKYDIDDNVRFFVDKWIQRYNFVLKN